MAEVTGQQNDPSSVPPPEPTLRFSESVHTAAGDLTDMLKYIEDSLAYCGSIPEVDIVKDLGNPENWRKSVTFRVRVFANSSIRRIEQLLLGLISETNAHRLDTAVILARAIMESTAVVYYGYKMIEAHKRNGKQQCMDDNLQRLLMGSNSYTTIYPGGNKPITPDMAIGKVDDDRHSTTMRDQYTWLSEFAHPNGPSMVFFHQSLDKATGTMRIRKKAQLDRSWIHQIHVPVAALMDLAEEGWKWMLALDWK